MRENYDKFLNSLKIKYGDGYLALATPEEREEFTKLFATSSLISIDKAREFVEKTIIIQKNNLFYKPYIDYVKTLEDRYGRYYFSKMNTAEREKLINLYTKYMQNKNRKFKKEDAFTELYYKELNKYKEDRLEIENAIERMNLMVVNTQMSIMDLGVNKSVK